MAWNAFELQTPQGLDRSKDVKSRVLSEGEAEFYTGDLLMRLDRVQDAEAHLKKALQAEPKIGSIQAAMGRFLLEQKETRRRRDLHEKSCGVGSRQLPDALLLCDRPQRLKGHGRRGGSDTLRQELQKTIELSPGFVEATEMLANENLVRNLDMPQTVELLTRRSPLRRVAIFFTSN
jgi:tetratricopeptide (TPR) repeat protein